MGCVKDALGIPVGFDTDVNGSLLGEITWGCARGLTDAVYLTIGTGIGGGVMSNGKLLHGMLHPELGHIRLEKKAEDKGIHVSHCREVETCFISCISGGMLIYNSK